MLLNEELKLPNVNGDVGIEIEMEGTGIHLSDLYYWRTAEDGSLRGESVEWVTISAIGRTHINKVLQYLINRLEKSGSVLTPSKRCGTHIHINCQQMTSPQIVNFICIYLIVEDILMRSFGEARDGNMFCLSCKDADYLISMLLECIQKGSFRYVSPAIRYSSVNLASLTKYGSLEFRGMPSPKNLQLVANWAHIFLNMRDTAMEFTDTRDIVEGISHRGQAEFVSAIFGEHLPTIMRPDLDYMVMNGVRRVQTIAYTKWNELNTKVNKTENLQRFENLFAANRTATITVTPNTNTIEWRPVAHPLILDDDYVDEDDLEED